MANFLTNCVTPLSGVYQTNKDANKQLDVEGTKHVGLAVLSHLSSKRNHDNSGIQTKIQMRSSLLCMNFVTTKTPICL